MGSGNGKNDYVGGRSLMVEWEISGRAVSKVKGMHAMDKYEGDRCFPTGFLMLGKVRERTLHE